MIATADSLRQQLSAYAEPWTASRARDVEPWELSGWLRVGLSLFGLVRAMDEHWSDEVRQGDPNDPQGREIADLYRTWSQTASVLLRRAQAFRQRGIEVEDAIEFERAYRQASLALALDAASIHKAERQLGSGGGRPLQEVRDELLGGHRR